MRDSGDAPSRIHTSISTDQGYSWTPSKKIAIANTASVAVLVLNDGRWLLVCNDVADGRYRLAALISNDEGQSWKVSRYFENDQPGEGRYSYPTVCQDGEGIIHLTYSYHLADGKKSIKYVYMDSKALK
jgi:predicted neuraminidase